MLIGIFILLDSVIFAFLKNQNQMKKTLIILILSLLTSQFCFCQFDNLKKTIKKESEKAKSNTIERGKYEAKKKASKEIDKQVNKLKK